MIIQSDNTLDNEMLVIHDSNLVQSPDWSHLGSELTSEILSLPLCFIKKIPTSSWKWISTYRRMKVVHLYHHFSVCAQIITKWTKYLNIRPETLKLQWKGVGHTCQDIVMGIYYFGTDCNGTEHKSKNSQMGFHQTKNFYRAQKMINRERRLSTT